jgi:phosphatidate cytidylyltransferase
LAPNTSLPPWLNTQGESDASVLVLAERTAGRWADLRKRAVSAAALAPLAVGCVWLGGWAFSCLVVAGAVGLAVEWFRLCRGSSWRPLAPLGWLYVVLAGVALLWLRADPVAGRADLLFLLLIIWAGDTGAYLFGRWVGGPRLAPRISPGKTWSGALGGVLAAVAFGLIAAQMLSDVANWRAMVIAAGLSVVAQAGDLLESFVKRRLEVKDSGQLIPGHGGLFDRLDSILAAAPVAALLALFVGRGVVLWQ